MAKMTAAGVDMVGYVHTSYGDRAASDVNVCLLVVLIFIIIFSIFVSYLLKIFYCRLISMPTHPNTRDSRESLLTNAHPLQVKSPTTPPSTTTSRPSPDTSTPSLTLAPSPTKDTWMYPYSFFLSCLEIFIIFI
jgi:hypothetical protein